ncbi:MAG: ribosome maturation factor RimM [Oscillospiraceae bacterium]
MKKEFLEAGKIINTHGIRGEVKIQVWADSPDFLCSFEYLYVDEVALKVLSAKVHKDSVIVSFDGITDIDAAVRLKNKIVFIDRKAANLPYGKHFVQDIIGITAYDADTGAELGVVSEVLPLPSGNVYVIKGGREILVPAVDEFIIETDTDSGKMRVHLIEGM